MVLMWPGPLTSQPAESDPKQPAARAGRTLTADCDKGALGPTRRGDVQDGAKGGRRPLPYAVSMLEGPAFAV